MGGVPSLVVNFEYEAFNGNNRSAQVIITRAYERSWRDRGPIYYVATVCIFLSTGVMREYPAVSIFWSQGRSQFYFNLDVYDTQSAATQSNISYFISMQ